MKIILLLALATVFTEAKHHHLRKLGRSGKRGHEGHIDVVGRSEFKLGTIVPEGSLTRKACFDAENAKTISYGADMRLKDEDDDCCFEIEDEKTPRSINCVECKKGGSPKRRGRQTFVLTRLFDDREERFAMLGFGRDEEVYVIEFDQTSPTNLNINLGPLEHLVEDVYDTTLELDGVDMDDFLEQ